MTARTAPALTIDLRLSDDFVDLVAEGFDVAIRGGILLASEYVARLLVPVTPMLCASPSYLERHGTPRSIDDLKAHRLVAMRSSRSSRLFAWEFVNPKGGTTRQEFEPSFVVNDPAGLLRAATLGMGIAQIGSNLALQAFANGGLVQLLLDTTV